MTVSFVTVADVKQFLPIRSANASFDAKIQALILTVSAEIESVCKQSFAAETRTEYHTARLNFRDAPEFGGWAETPLSRSVTEQAVLLRAAPLDLNVPVRVWYDPSRRFRPEDELTPGTDFFVDPNPKTPRILISAPTVNREYGFKVEYRAGFEVADGTLSASLAEKAPALKHACVTAVVELFNATQDNADAEKTNPGCVLPPHVLTLLSPYRRILTGRG